VGAAPERPDERSSVGVGVGGGGGDATGGFSKGKKNNIQEHNVEEVLSTPY
jgi:hypothetical protein